MMGKSDTKRLVWFLFLALAAWNPSPAVGQRCAVAPVLSWTLSRPELPEGGSVTVTFTLEDSLNVDFRIQIRGNNNPSGITSPNSVEIAAGQKTTTAVIESAADGNTVDERLDFSILPTASGVNPNCINISTGSFLGLYVADGLPDLSFRVRDPPVMPEGVVGSFFAIRVTRLLGAPLRVPLTVDAGTTEDGDIGMPTEITVRDNNQTRFAEGHALLTAFQDDDRDDETFTVSLGTLPPNTVEVVGPTTYTVTIVDDDVGPRVSLEANPSRVNEGESVTVTARLTKALSSQVTIPVIVEAGTTEQGDIGPLAEIRIGSNQLAGTGNITANEDDDADDESFTVSLGRLPNTVTAGTPISVTIEIVDNDDDTDTPGAPGAPTGLTATADGGTAINLSWSAPVTAGSSAITGYRIEVSSNGGSTWTDLVANTQSTATTYRHTALLPGTTRDYRVSAINGQGTGPASNVAQATTVRAAGVPGAPTGLTAAADGGTAIRLSWSAPVTAGSSAITGYRIEVSSNGGSTWTDLVANTQSTATTYRHTGLLPGTTRHYRVSAINGQGTGPASNVAQATTVRAAGVPGAPTGLTAAADGSTAIRLSWSAPVTAGSSAITGYRIEVSSNGGSTWTDLVANTGSAATSYRHAGLLANTTRHYRVSAINARGAGPPSNVAQATTTTTGTGVPGAPTGLTATPDGSTAIRLSWTVPGSTGGSAITGYRIEVSSNGGATWAILVSNTGSTATSYLHTGLSPGTTRHYRASAINARGTGPVSNVASATIGTGRPSAPRDVSASASGTTVTVRWTAPAGGAPVTGYQVEVSSDCRSWRVLSSTIAAATLSYTHADLEPKTTYCYRVLARNRVGLSEPSDVARAETEAVLPGQVRDLSAVAQGRSEILLDWQPPADDGGSPVTGYRIERSADEGASWLTIRANTGTANTSYMDRELGPGTLYRYRVSAVNEVGQGPPSEFAEARTHGPPGPPLDLIAEAVSAEQINLRWSPPDTDGGRPVTGYVLEFSSDGGGDWEVLSRLAGELTYGHRGLRAGTVYHYRVSAVNEIGVGLPSQTAEARTLAGLPDPPRDLTARAAGADRIDLRWRAPAHDGGSAVTGYFVEASTDGGASWFVAAESHDGLGFMHTGLSPATVYRYRVSAINGEGTGEPGAFVEARTRAAVPARPAVLVAEAASHDRIELRWLRPESDGGSPVVGYRIDVTDDGGGTWLPLIENTGTTTTSHEHGGLAHATVYRYRVAAINEVGRGPWSPHAEARTHAVVPGSPRELTAAVAAHDQIDLAWRPPADDGGAPVTATVVEVSRDRREWAVLAEVEAPAQAYSHVGPEPGVTWSYRVSAVNEAGRGAASEAASATIDDAVRRTDRVNEAILPYFAASAAGSAVRAISDRVAAVAAGGAADARANLTGAQNGLRGLADGAAVSRRVGGGLSVWAAADLAGLGGEGTVEWDGEVFSMHAGVDGLLRRDILVGLAGNRSGGAFEFTDRTNGRGMAGEYEATLTTITPYAAWVREDVSVWTAAGSGWGLITLADSAAERTSHIESSMLAGGGTRELGSSRVGSFGLRAEGWAAELRVGGNVPAHLGLGTNPEHINEAAFAMRRARIMLDWTIAAQTGSNRFEAVLRGGARRDWHSTDTGVGGAELGGELRMVGARIRARGEGRMFVHSTYREWGVRGMIELRSRDGGDGLSLQANPSYGAAGSGVAALWDNGAQAAAGIGPAGGPGARLDVTAAYKPPGAPLAVVGRYDSSQRALAFGTKLQRTVEWLLESRYTERGGLGLSFKGSRRF